MDTEKFTFGYWDTGDSDRMKCDPSTAEIALILCELRLTKESPNPTPIYSSSDLLELREVFRD